MEKKDLEKHIRKFCNDSLKDVMEIFKGDPYLIVDLSKIGHGSGSIKDLVSMHDFRFAEVKDNSSKSMKEYQALIPNFSNYGIVYYDTIEQKD